MASKLGRRKIVRAELLRQAKVYVKEHAWIEQIGLDAKDVADWFAEVEEVAAAVTHGELRRRSGVTLRRHALGMDARYSTFRRMEATSAKNLTLRELSRVVEGLGFRLKLYAYDGTRRTRVRMR